MAVQPKPVGPRLLVKPLEANEQTSAGIVLPNEVRNLERRGVVQEVGDGWYRELREDTVEFTPLSIKRGEVVVYPDKAGVKVRLDLNENGKSEEFLVLHVNDVLLVLVDVPSIAPVEP